MKRRLSGSDGADSRRPPSGGIGKRRRLGSRNNLLDLPHEIVLRVLTFLNVRQLVTLDLVSRRFRQLSTDSELWKTHFYQQWIEPRARRIPETMRPSAKILVQWLEHGEMLREDMKVHWKRRYRLRNNWDTGEARLHEVEIAKPPAPPVLARVNKGLVFTIDAVSGLRAWSHQSNSKRLEAHTKVRVAQPTSIAADSSSGQQLAAIGFDDGGCEVYRLRDTAFERLLEFSVPGSCAVMSMALADYHMVVMTSDRHIHLLQLSAEGSEWSASSMTVLHADSPLHPAALSLRCHSRNVIATIAYAFSRLGQEWCIGLQEIKVSRENGAVESRIASSIETPLDARYRGPGRWEITSRSAFSAPLTSLFSVNLDVKTPPTSLSYSHPFLLASLADNTIMSYIVQSDDEKLEVSSGRRLFGHTSAITSAEVSNRGKAVSISAKGDEIRVWELEELLTTFRGSTSTQVRPRNAALDVATALAARGNGLGLALQAMKRELAMTRRWVSFDDEQVVVLGERDQRQIMACYDFSA